MQTVLIGRQRHPLGELLGREVANAPWMRKRRKPRCVVGVSPSVSLTTICPEDLAAERVDHGGAQHIATTAQGDVDGDSSRYSDQRNAVSGPTTSPAAPVMTAGRLW